MDRMFEVLRSDQCADTYQAWDLTECKKMVMKKQVIQNVKAQEQVMHNGNQASIKKWIMDKGGSVGNISFEVRVKEDGTANFPSFKFQEPFPDAPKLYIFTYDPQGVETV